MKDLVGKTIKISTVEGHYGLGNPRPWTASLITDQGPFTPSDGIPDQFTVPVLLANQAVSGGQVVQAPAQPAGNAEAMADDLPF